MGYNTVADNMGRLAIVGSQICEIRRNFERIWPCSNSRKSKVIDIGVTDDGRAIA